MDYKTITEIIDSLRKHPTRTILAIAIMVLVAISAMFFSGFFSELGKRIVSEESAKETIVKRSSKRAVEELEQMGIAYNGSSFLKYVEKGKTEVVKLFLEAGIFTETKDTNGLTALIIASNEGHTEIVRILVEKNADVNASTGQGRTALTGAARRGYSEIVKILLANGADPNVNPECNWTPIVGAVESTDETMVHLLLKSGVDLSYEDAGTKALLTAAEKDSLPIVRLLLGQGVDVNARTHGERTALMNAAKTGSLELVRFLLDHGAKVNVRDYHKVTPLMEAADAYRPQICKELLERSADVNPRDTHGRTALGMLFTKPSGGPRGRPTFIHIDNYTDTIDILKQYEGIEKESVKATPTQAIQAPKEKESLKTTKTPLPDQKSYTNSIGMEFVLIPAGTFMMGSPNDEPERGPNETLRKITIIRPFYMQTTEVAQGQWKAVMGNNPSYYKDCGEDCPVEKVSWNNVEKFIDKLNQREGARKYRLPTEAEWEYACRAGTTTSFYTGKCITSDQANYDGSRTIPGCPKGLERGKPVNVGSYQPNSWGLYDMHGNVWEMCQDWYETYFPISVTDPTGPSSGKERVIRGGAFLNPARYLRSAARFTCHPEVPRDGIGFRLAMTSPQFWPKQKHAPKVPKTDEIGRDGFFVSYASGIVRNTWTGLEWVAGPDKPTNWNEAKSWVESLHIDGGGWRMPIIKELEALYEEGKGKRNITPLLKTTGWYVWSEETEGTSSAWVFNFVDGDKDRTDRSGPYNGGRSFAVRSRSEG